MEVRVRVRVRMQKATKMKIFRGKISRRKSNYHKIEKKSRNTTWKQKMRGTWRNIRRNSGTKEWCTCQGFRHT